ncbi:hypothetical protein [Fastidiosibacter lacustris]|uniref:hypothetical protein n=1 Tax=Fastidiosibacter lacustris TaxID=2056695 RepID=UPI0013005B8D|nr:hypothetical protein [Fastidiosibacter lacustris]
MKRNKIESGMKKITLLCLAGILTACGGSPTANDDKKVSGIVASDNKGGTIFPEYIAKDKEALGSLSIGSSNLSSTLKVGSKHVSTYQIKAIDIFPKNVEIDLDNLPPINSCINASPQSFNSFTEFCILPLKAKFDTLGLKNINIVIDLSNGEKISYNRIINVVNKHSHLLSQPILMNSLDALDNKIYISGDKKVSLYNPFNYAINNINLLLNGEVIGKIAHLEGKSSVVLNDEISAKINAVRNKGAANQAGLLTAANIGGELTIQFIDDRQALAEIENLFIQDTGENTVKLITYRPNLKITKVEFNKNTLSGVDWGNENDFTQNHNLNNEQIYELKFNVNSNAKGKGTVEITLLDESNKEHPQEIVLTSHITVAPVTLEIQSNSIVNDDNYAQDNIIVITNNSKFNWAQVDLSSFSLDGLSLVNNGQIINSTPSCLSLTNNILNTNASCYLKVDENSDTKSGWHNLTIKKGDTNLLEDITVAIKSIKSNRSAFVYEPVRIGENLYTLDVYNNNTNEDQKLTLSTENIKIEMGQDCLNQNISSKSSCSITFSKEDVTKEANIQYDIQFANSGQGDTDLKAIEQGRYNILPSERLYYIDNNTELNFYDLNQGENKEVKKLNETDKITTPIPFNQDFLKRNGYVNRLEISQNGTLYGSGRLNSGFPLARLNNNILNLQTTPNYIRSFVGSKDAVYYSFEEHQENANNENYIGRWLDADSTLDNLRLKTINLVDKLGIQNLENITDNLFFVKVPKSIEVTEHKTGKISLALSRSRLLKEIPHYEWSGLSGYYDDENATYTFTAPYYNPTGNNTHQITLKATSGESVQTSIILVEVEKNDDLKGIVSVQANDEVIENEKIALKAIFDNSNVPQRQVKAYKWTIPDNWEFDETRSDDNQKQITVIAPAWASIPKAVFTVTATDNADITTLAFEHAVTLKANPNLQGTARISGGNEATENDTIQLTANYDLPDDSPNRKAESYTWTIPLDWGVVAPSNLTLIANTSNQQLIVPANVSNTITVKAPHWNLNEVGLFTVKVTDAAGITTDNLAIHNVTVKANTSLGGEVNIESSTNSVIENMEITLHANYITPPNSPNRQPKEDGYTWNIPDDWSMVSSEINKATLTVRAPDWTTNKIGSFTVTALDNADVIALAIPYEISVKKDMNVTVMLQNTIGDKIHEFHIDLKDITTLPAPPPDLYSKDVNVVSLLFNKGEASRNEYQACWERTQTNGGNYAFECTQDVLPEITDNHYIWKVVSFSPNREYNIYLIPTTTGSRTKILHLLSS